MLRGDFLKKGFILLLSLTLVLCFVLSSCGGPLDALENFCFAVKDFDIERMSSYTEDNAEKYFENVKSYEAMLSDEQREVAAELFSRMSFNDITEENGYFTVTVKYVDIASIISTVNISLATGTENASHYIKDIIESGRLETQFIKTKQGVKVTVSETEKGSKLILGYSSENKEFTTMLGLENFLRWYSAQR